MEQQENELHGLRTKPTRKDTKVEQAIALKLRRNELSDAEVADAVGCYHSTLTRSTEYQRYATAADRSLVRERENRGLANLINKFTTVAAARELGLEE